jgi:hypothetical protein
MYLVSATPTKLLIEYLWNFYAFQTLEYMDISKLPMRNEQIWSYVKETTSHLQNKLTKNIHLGVTKARHMILLITIDIDRSQPSNNVENILVLNLMEIWQLTLIEDRNKK